MLRFTPPGSAVCSRLPMAELQSGDLGKVLSFVPVYVDYNYVYRFHHRIKYEMLIVSPLSPDIHMGQMTDSRTCGRRPWFDVDALYKYFVQAAPSLSN